MSRSNDPSPLLRWMRSKKLRPYSSISPLVTQTNLSRGFVGDLAMGKRTCMPEVLLQFQQVTGDEFIAAEMMDWWARREGLKSLAQLRGKS